MGIKNVIAKSLSFIVILTSVATAIPAKAMDKDSSLKIVNENSEFKVMENDLKRIVVDKKSSKKVELTFDDTNRLSGVLKDSEGKTHKYRQDLKGNMYLDGTLVVEKITKEVPVESNDHKRSKRSTGYTNPKTYEGSDGRTYYYVTTYRTNTKVQSDYQSLMLTLTGLIPGLGTITGIAGIVSYFISRGEPVMYLEQDVYCTSDYRFYCYRTWFYTNSDYSGYVKGDISYKQMW